MRILAPILALALCVTPAAAQDEDEGRIVRFLEEQLSDGTNLQVDIQGFRGALSSTAELDRLILSDADGPWLILENAELDWSRSALLTGSLQVNQLTAERLEVLRTPTPSDAPAPLPDAETAPFALPELPVSIAIDRVAIARVSLGEPLLGFAVDLSVEGAVSLAGGAGSAMLGVQRLDGPRGVFDLDASYDNETEQLALQLLLEEDAGGLAAELLDLPGRPPLRLDIAGEGQVDDITAEIALATDGTPRLTGTVMTQADPETGTRLSRVDLGGDISPLLLPEYQAFFGDEVALQALIRNAADGATLIENLALRSAALDLAGDLAIGPDGQPQRFDLTGRIANANSFEPVRLPVPDAEVLVRSANLNLLYDRDAGDEYEATFDLAELDTGDFQARRVQLDAGGTLAQTDGALAVTSALIADITGLQHSDPALAEAIGDAVQLSADIGWSDGAPLTLDDINFRSGSLSLTGDSALALAENRLDLTFDLRANARDLSRFAAAAGQPPLAGALNADLTGETELLSGAFDVALRGAANDLRVNDALPPELLDGETLLDLSVARGENGLTIERLNVDGTQIALTASGAVNARESTLDATARLANVGLFTDQISGPISLDMALDRVADGPWDTQARVEGPSDLDATLDGNFTVPEGHFDLDIAASVRDVPLPDGVPASLLAGETTITVRATRDATGLTLEALDLQGTQLSVRGTGSLGEAQSTFDGTARLADVGLFTDLISGPISLDVALDRLGEGPVDTQARVVGPSDLDATLDGFFTIPEAHFDLAVLASVRDVPLPDSIPSALLAGETTLSVRAARDAIGLTLEALDLQGTQLRLSGSGTLGDADSAFDVTARLANVGLFTDVVQGPVTADLDVSRNGTGPWNTVADLQGPLGITAAVRGEVGLPDNAVALSATGRLPLALANRALSPRSLNGDLSFDLRVDGPPALNSVRGSFGANGVRVTLPTLRNALEGLDVNGTINSGQVQFSANGALGSGGTLTSEGNVNVGAPGLPATIAVNGTSLRLVDPTLYEALIDRVALDIAGNLTGSFNIGGTVDVGPTEVRVPEGGAGGAAGIPDITHFNETATERQTRAAAGLIRTDSGGGGSQRIGLDLTINAPGQIFIRGRGLDAELGGSLRLGGTTASIIPAGRFDLVRGRLAILGTRLDLNEGSASLQGSFDPFLRLIATSRAGEFAITISMIGPVTAPDITFSSDPALPEDEVLAQLLFGRSVSALSPIQLLQLADAAASLAGGSTNSGIFANLREGLGLDDLDFQTDAEGNAGVRAGRYLSENVYADVTLGAETDLSLNIDLTDDITARGSFSSDGSSSLGVFFERDY